MIASELLHVAILAAIMLGVFVTGAAMIERRHYVWRCKRCGETATQGDPFEKLCSECWEAQGEQEANQDAAASEVVPRGNKKGSTTAEVRADC